MFPIAISDFFLSEAAMQVISSGSDVPNATTVSEIVLSSTPITCAMLFADETVRSLPSTMLTSPIRVISIRTGILSFSVSCGTSSAELSSPFL